MKVIELKNVSRKFIKKEGINRSHSKVFSTNEEFWALKDISFEVEDGEIIGLIGRNGAGKTTLLEIIAGIIPVTIGNLRKTGEVSSLLTLGAGFQDELSGRENIYLNSSLLGLKKSDIKNKFDDVVKFSELGDFINEPLGGYSDGMKMRLGFSIATHIDFEILVIDEIIMVGDISFQKKCFRKLEEFKAQGKTMVISTQSMDVISKLCNRVILLEEGKLSFNGPTSEGINHYLKLLNQKKFLERQKRSNLVKDTKKWAIDMECWGEKKGSNEVEITQVKTLNRWHVYSSNFKTGSKLFVKANFKVHKKIKNYHFGIALFREDGVYCYGPNTKNDGYELRELSKGEGFFRLEYKKLLLNPGIYYLAVVIWDKDETFAYDYHRCCHSFRIAGKKQNGQLLNFFKSDNLSNNIKINYLKNEWGKKLQSNNIYIKDIKLLDKKGVSKKIFLTNEYVKIQVSFKINGNNIFNRIVLWVGLFREDGVYCHGTVKKIRSDDNKVSLVYNSLKLLPGGYRVSVGFWDIDKGAFVCFNHGNLRFNMVFTKKDHGTVYLDHKWKWKLPR